MTTVTLEPSEKCEIARLDRMLRTPWRYKRLWIPALVYDRYADREIPIRWWSDFGYLWELRRTALAISEMMCIIPCGQVQDG